MQLKNGWELDSAKTWSSCEPRVVNLSSRSCVQVDEFLLVVGPTCVRDERNETVAAVDGRLLIGHSKLCFSCWFDGLFLWRIGEPSEWRHSSTSYYARQPRHFFLEKNRDNMARALCPVFFWKSTNRKRILFSFFFGQKKKGAPKQEKETFHFAKREGGGTCPLVYLPSVSRLASSRSSPYGKWKLTTFIDPDVSPCRFFLSFLS